jgi:hypothetical protein
MNFKQSLAGISLATGAVFGMVAPAFAGVLTPSQLGLPTLGTPNVSGANSSITGGSYATQNLFPYRTTGFSFKRDTIVRFSLVEPSGLGSRGKSQSDFGFLFQNEFIPIFSETKAYDKLGDTAYEKNGGKINDWLGTCGNAIAAPCTKSVLFKANQTYQLALDPSSKPLHFGVGNLGSFTFNSVSDEVYPSKTAKLTTLTKAGALFIGMEDGLYPNSKTAQKDDFYYDYQDWVATANVPEPATVFGLGAVASGMLFARRRKAAI